MKEFRHKKQLEENFDNSFDDDEIDYSNVMSTVDAEAKQNRCDRIVVEACKNTIEYYKDNYYGKNFLGFNMFGKAGGDMPTPSFTLYYAAAEITKIPEFLKEEEECKGIYSMEEEAALDGFDAAMLMIGGLSGEPEGYNYPTEEDATRLKHIIDIIYKYKLYELGS